MNQILGNQFKNENNKNINLSSRKSQIIFFIASFVIIISIIFYIYLRYNASHNAKITKNLESKFEIRNLYSNTIGNYNAARTSLNFENKDPFVIGLLKIEKINLAYPILSETTDQLLEISPCRFYGPMPNQIGNMCIAGHNYANQTHFAKIHSLDEGDNIQIFDLNGNMIDYYIYSIQELPADDTSCLSQDTNNLREITLVTCNTIKGNRIVIKAKEDKT